jgi:hypothetical protein
MRAPGVYMYNWDVKNKNDELVTDGLYLCKFKANDYAEEKMMCVSLLETSVLEQSKAKYYTNENGIFEIDYKKIPTGYKLNYTEETGPEIIDQWIVPDSLTFILTKNGYESIRKKILIDTTKIIEHSFIMNEN